jgi:hypothetical protein
MVSIIIQQNESNSIKPANLRTKSDSGLRDLHPHVFVLGQIIYVSVIAWPIRFGKELPVRYHSCFKCQRYYFIYGWFYVLLL